ncbi:MAG: 50S ribosomal protein L1 [Candidatus Babeliaceae bacterium]
MTKHGKKYNKARELLGTKTSFPLQEGVAKVKELAHARFDESVDANINLGIDPSKGEQVVRGSVILPHTIGKKVRILAFAKGDYGDAAQKAGADFVGVEDFIAKIESGWMDFDYAVATPDLMGLVGKVAKILGPRGLLPNKKSGTVTFDVAAIISDLKKGRLFFKNDKNAIVHFRFGKAKALSASQLAENLNVFLKALATCKPPTSKGKFIKKISISSTMGPGIHIVTDEL